MLLTTSFLNFLLCQTEAILIQTLFMGYLRVREVYASMLKLGRDSCLVYREDFQTAHKKDNKQST